MERMIKYAIAKAYYSVGTATEHGDIRWLLLSAQCWRD